MYSQASEVATSGVVPVVAVMALTAVAAIGITAWLVRDIACRAIARADPHELPAVLHALAAMLGPLGAYLPWSGRNNPAGMPVPGRPQPCQGNSRPEHLEEGHDAQSQAGH